MTLLIGIGIGYLLCLASVWVTFVVGESAHIGEHPFADDPRPATLLQEQAE